MNSAPRSSAACASLAMLGFACAAVLAVHPLHANEAPRGDLFLALENDDGHSARSAGSLLWVTPLSEGLDAELGARVARFDASDWGYAILGASWQLPDPRHRLRVRYEHGAGEGPKGRFQHLVGSLGWTHEVWPGRLFADTELRVLRVDGLRDELARLGLSAVPTRWMLLRGGYFHSLPGRGEVEAWTGQVDLTLRRSTLFAGYARSEDTVDLRSIGLGRQAGRPTDEFTLGIRLPWRRHGITLAATHYESEFDTRLTLRMVLRFGLSPATLPPVEAGPGHTPRNYPRPGPAPDWPR